LRIAISKWRSQVQIGGRQFKVANQQFKVAIASSNKVAYTMALNGHRTARKLLKGL